MIQHARSKNENNFKNLSAVGCDIADPDLELQND
jgi:hypothetical protein